MFSEFVGLAEVFQQMSNNDPAAGDMVHRSELVDRLAFGESS